MSPRPIVAADVCATCTGWNEPERRIDETHLGVRFGDATKFDVYSGDRRLLNVVELDARQGWALVIPQPLRLCTECGELLLIVENIPDLRIVMRRDSVDV